MDATANNQHRKALFCCGFIDSLCEQSRICDSVDLITTLAAQSLKIGVLTCMNRLKKLVSSDDMHKREADQKKVK